MDDESMWAADRVVASTLGFAITIPETANEFAIKGNMIKIFYHGLSEITQEVLNAAAGGIFFYKTPNQAYQLLEDKVLLKLDWAKNQKTESSFKKTVAFADEDAQYKELQSRAKQPTSDLDDDDIPILADKQSGRPSGSLPRNTQPNPRGSNSKAYQQPNDEDDEPTPQPKIQTKISDTLSLPFDFELSWTGSLNGVSVLPNNMAYSVNTIHRTAIQQTHTVHNSRSTYASCLSFVPKWSGKPLAQKQTNWFDHNLEVLKTKFLNKYCPPAHTVKKIEEINNFQQEPDESLFRAWERFKELLTKCPQHYLTDMQEVILFNDRLDVPTRQILDSRGAIPTKTTTDAKVAIQEMVEYSQKWHNGTSSKRKSTETSDGLAAIQAQLNNLGREIKKRGQYRAAGLGFYQPNNRNSLYPARRDTMEESLSKFMAESAKRHEENSNIIKEIQASTDAAIRNQGSSIKTLELQIRQMTLVDLGASVSVMLFSTYTNLCLGVLSHTRLTIELADRTIKQPRGIAKNVLVRIGKFVFPIDFIILDIPENKDVPLILERPFLSTAHVKIDMSARDKAGLRSSDFTCESNSSKETHESMPESVVNEPKVVSQPKFWTDAPIIEEYESDSDDKHVSLPSKEHETPILTRTSKIQVNTARASSTNNVNTVRASSTKDVNTAEVKSVSAAGGKWETVVKPLDVPHKALENKGIIDSRCSRHMTGNKAYLVDYQDNNGDHIAFGGSKGFITGKGSIS
ncbi:zf-CCHC domain-containing protein [Tanacetum coccineum]